MNHGNSNKPDLNLLNKLDNYLAKVFLRKDDFDLYADLSKKQVSKLVFILVFITLFVSLWCLTGLYVVSKNQVAIQFDIDGKLDKIITTPGLHISEGYPFGGGDLIDIDSTNDAVLHELKLDNKQYTLNYKYNLQIIDVKQYVNTLYHEKDTMLTDFVQQALNTVIKNAYTTAETPNISAQVDSLNYSLVNYGVAIKDVTLSKPSLTPESEIAISQAINSSNSNISKSQQQLIDSDMDLFYKLSAQYTTAPKLVKELVYYKLLSQIPVDPLSLVKDDALVKNSRINTSGAVANTVREVRDVSRDTSRDRVARGR